MFLFFFLSTLIYRRYTELSLRVYKLSFLVYREKITISSSTVCNPIAYETLTIEN